MNINKIIASSLLTVSLAGIAMTANADDMRFNNNTNYTLSFGINNVCSEALGIIEKNTVKTIDQATFEDICKYNPAQCTIAVYNQPGCDGNSVANMTFNQTALDNVGMAFGGNVTIKGNGSTIIFK